MNKPNKIIRLEILKDIEEATVQMQKARDDFMQRVRILEALHKAKTCKHKWIDGGSSLLVVDKCSKCGYTRYL